MGILFIGHCLDTFPLQTSLSAIQTITNNVMLISNETINVCYLRFYDDHRHFPTLGIKIKVFTLCHGLKIFDRS